MIETTEGKLWRVNSLITDTCNLILALWKILKKDRCLEHIFCAPYNSYGIQLLIKDILSIQWYAEVICRAQLIVRCFCAAYKEYNVLKDLQMAAYREHRSLILHCITRWRIQVGMLGSVLKMSKFSKTMLNKGTLKLIKEEKKMPSMYS